jgi:hypothetical protein
MKNSTILTIESLAARIRALANRAFDVSDRNTGETDRDLYGRLIELESICDCCVWHRCSDFDEAELNQLRYACDHAANAMRFLRSECPNTQRNLAAVSAEDAAFIHSLILARSRINTPFCRLERPESGPDALSQVVTPFSGLHLDSLIRCCRTFAQARRVLGAFGIESKFGKLDDGERVLLARGHVIRLTRLVSR